MLVIFDFDGVFFEASWKNIFDGYEAVIKALGKNPKDFFRNLEEFKKWWSLNWHENNKKIGIQNLNQTPESHNLFYKVYNSGLGLFPWVRPLTKVLYQKHQLAVLTNRHKDFAKKCLKPVEKYLSLIVGCEDVKNLKPDSEGINFILWKTGMPRLYSLIIGDTVVDIKAGKNAGIKTGAVKWGLGDWDKLLAENPDYKFSNWNDLLWL